MAKRGNKRQKSTTFDPETIYQYWSQAGGNICKAIRLAKAAGDDRVPKRRETWARHAKQNNFSERLKEEEAERWKKFNEERHANEQRVFDQLSASFEMVAAHFYNKVSDAFQKLQTLEKGHKDRKAAEKWLETFFGSMQDVDRFYRMHLRARQLPERINQERLTHEGSVPVTYGDVEGANPDYSHHKSNGASLHCVSIVLQQLNSMQEAQRYDTGCLERVD